MNEFFNVQKLMVPQKVTYNY